MARHTFGQSLTDWTMGLGASATSEGVTTAPVIATGPATITLWSAQTGGIQYTDLLNGDGAAVTAITSSDGSDGLPIGTIPEFSGPDNITEMWASADGGVRFKMVATDLGGALAVVEEHTAAIEDLQTHRLPAILWDAGASAYPERTPELAGKRVEWVGPSAPPVSSSHAAEGDIWMKTIV
ncbi:hypothetical protein E1287_07545 [Actinomadura sp. KC06]|uniref:hypothetical protein n=1 Tax=Actinomadura sp. KC06 TaxID=2530369 RepID=UPI00104A343B|nr:hypothetical protein [Actinomadura sp. KC06]TDD37902.1 hypothetical protein E1287_07545 [Actinomadura sp. KC06]